MKKYNKIDLENSRDISLRIFDIAVNNEYRLSDELSFFEKNFTIEKLKMNFVYEITEGTMKNLLLLDEYIILLTKKNILKLDSIILNILRLGIYEILFMDSPDFAVVNECVNLAKKYSHEGAVKFTNGVLRNFIRKKVELNNTIDSYSFDKKISIKNSFPLWIIQYWSSFIKKEELEKLLLSMNEKPLLYLRINTLKVSIDEFLNALNSENILFTKTNINEIIKIESKLPVTEIHGFKEGFCYIQDLSAGYVSKYLNPQEEDNVLDFCSFPGGKTTHISQLMNNKGKIIALDNNKKREQIFLENINKLGCTNIENFIFSVEKELNDLDFIADKILVDPPCSGLGVIRRKPEIKYRRKKEDINRLSDLQYEILDNAKKYLKKDGELVYSTCTISKTENENVIKRFLSNNSNFVLEKINNHDFINLYPYRDKTDGFFISKLKRIS